jgi:hypothetical protein
MYGEALSTSARRSNPSFVCSESSFLPKNRSKLQAKQSVFNESLPEKIAMNTHRIVSRQLTTCTVIEGGKTIRFDLAGQAGEPVSIEMPFDQAESIVMTIPRLLSAALRMQTGDSQARYVFPVGNWSLELAKDQNYRILGVRTPDGFEVAFAISFETSVAMGSALTCASEAASEKC